MTDTEGPMPVEARMRQCYQELVEGHDGALCHEEAIVEALKAAVGIGYDDAHLARAARALVEIDEAVGIS